MRDLTLILNILIVEDDKMQNLMLDIVLRKKGYKVITSFDGLEAIEKLNKEHIDLVISDIDMANMDGLQLKEEMNKNNEWKKIPFIFLTSRDNSLTKNKAKALGVTGYLQKPYIVKIVEEIEKLM